MNAAEYVANAAPKELLQRLDAIRAQKQNLTRPVPSANLIDKSSLLTPQLRMSLIDSVASLVDENVWGRSEMCVQFAQLLTLSLRHFGLDARAVAGTAIYFSNSNEIYRWQHMWVRVGLELVDANTDCLSENPAIPALPFLSPYWGPVSDVPKNRRLREDRGVQIQTDTDVETIWWPELETKLSLSM